jgi:putative membrane protein
MKLILKWLLSATALLALANLDPGVEVRGFGSALLASLVIGLLNLVVRPILVVLTLPVTLVSLGLFLFIINAGLFWAASAILDGFQVRNFGHALLGSLIYSGMGLVIHSALEHLFPPR